MTTTKTPVADLVDLDGQRLDAMLAHAPETGALSLASLTERIMAEALTRPRIVAGYQPLATRFTPARSAKSPPIRRFWPEAAVLAASLFAGVTFGLTEQVGTYFEQLVEAAGLTSQQASISVEDLFGGQPQTEGLL